MEEWICISCEEVFWTDAAVERGAQACPYCRSPQVESAGIVDFDDEEEAY